MAEHKETPRRGGGGPFGGHGIIGTGAKSKDFRASGKRLVGLLRPHYAMIALVIVLAIVSVTLSTVGPRILGQATNLLFAGVIQSKLPHGVTQAQVVAGLRARGQTQFAEMLSHMTLTPGAGVDFGAIGRILLLLTGIYLLSVLFGYLQQYLTVGVSQGIVYDLRNEVDSKLTRLPLRYFDDHARGDILSRVTNDIDNIAQTLQQALTQITTAVLTVLGVLVMMLLISPLLAFISLLAVPLSVVVTMQIAKRSQKQFAAQWKHTGTLNGHIEETHTGRNIVKVFGREKDVQERFDEENEKLFEASFKAQFISGIIQPSMNFISNLNYVAIAVIGGLRVASGTMSLGDVQAFIQYTRAFTWPITQLASIANVMQSAVASAERVFELLDEAEEEPDTEAPVRLEKVAGHITLDDVSFRYKADEPLIQDLCLDVQPGRTVAIVGPTGAGKTTLVNLLLRFYEIDHGRILVDGVDTRDMTREDLRRLFGMVLQDAWLFGGTIRENIAYGREGATDEEIMRAAEAAHVDHFVRTLADGYDTRLDDDATNVSQGEKQLLTIARAFLADPQILILDEATSSVDTRTEVLIQKAMARLMENRTSFVIAHRLSTIRDADTILVMNHGRLVEQGTHQQLLARQGFYWELYNSQFAEPLEEAV
ncbi:MAG TPA: ABC transporter ATP-binding protein [Coriobacteriia bacterium]|jgi:ATP-binding cassette subfamily B protein